MTDTRTPAERDCDRLMRLLDTPVRHVMAPVHTYAPDGEADRLIAEHMAGNESAESDRALLERSERLAMTRSPWVHRAQRSAQAGGALPHKVLADLHTDARVHVARETAGDVLRRTLPTIAEASNARGYTSEDDWDALAETVHDDGLPYGRRRPFEYTPVGPDDSGTLTFEEGGPA